MDCPVCRHALQERTANGIVVDVCAGGCGGIWFDHGELQRLDDADERAGEELTDIPRDPKVQIDAGKRRHCPRCHDVVMMRHYYSVKREAVVDQCAGCGGFWLDAGELAAIRKQYQTQTEREADLQKNFDRIVGVEMDRSIKDERKALENLRLLTKFFRLSYFMTGQ